MRTALNQLKFESGKRVNDEIKLKSVTELNYFTFLQRLGELNGLLFTVATDASNNHPRDVIKHRKAQVSKITEHKDKMVYESGRQSIQYLADQVEALSPQLYAQLNCQVHLIYDVINDGVLYFVQRFPKSLGAFRWRIDQKNTTKINYEDAFEKISPLLLQSMSFEKPHSTLIGADYSAFEHFDFAEGEVPTYLKSHYGIDVKSGFNIGKLLHENLKFEDSTQNQGVQVADLLASGLRRCLRNEFDENRKAAYLLGRLMLQGRQSDFPIRLLGFRETHMSLSDQLIETVTILKRSSRPMLV